MPCRAPAVLCRDLQKSLSERRARSTAGAQHVMCESNTAVLCKQMWKTRHGRGTACCVWMSLNFIPLHLSSITHGESGNFRVAATFGSWNNERVWYCNIFVECKMELWQRAKRSFRFDGYTCWTAGVGHVKCGMVTGHKCTGAFGMKRSSRGTRNKHRRSEKFWSHNRFISYLL